MRACVEEEEKEREEYFSSLLHCSDPAKMAHFVSHETKKHSLSKSAYQVSQSSIQAEKKVPFLTFIPHLTFARSIHPKLYSLMFVLSSI